MPIDIDIQGAGVFDRAAEHMAAARARLAFDLEKASKEFAQDAGRRIKKDYLSGPRPSRLGVRTGRLRSSITTRVSLQNQDIVIEVGTNVDYAAAHEFGFRGTVNVRAHDRVVRKVFGRSVEARIAHVSGHPRKVNLPARPFLQPGVADATPGFEQRIGEVLLAITEGLESHGV